MPVGTYLISVVCAGISALNAALFAAYDNPIHLGLAVLNGLIAIIVAAKN